jgi:hypothetical protein
LSFDDTDTYGPPAAAGGFILPKNFPSPAMMPSFFVT